MSEECENTAITGYTGSDPEDCDFVEADIGDDSDTGEDGFYNGDEPSTAEITEIPSLLETEASPTPEVRTEPILTPETSRDEEKEKEDRKKKQKGKWKSGGGGGGGGGGGQKGGRGGGKDDNSKGDQGKNKQTSGNTNNNANKTQKKQNQGQQKNSPHNSSSNSGSGSGKQNLGRVQNHSLQSSNSSGDSSSNSNSKNIDNFISNYKITSSNSGNNHNNTNNGNKNNSFNHNNSSSGNSSNSSGSSSNSNASGSNNNNKNEKNDPPNILKFAKGIISQTRRDRKSPPDTINSFVLKMHYCLGVCVFLLAYNIVQGNWFLRDTIHCVEAFNGDTLVSTNKKNICLSYPYTCEPPAPTRYGSSECQRRYQLFYRWIHFTFLILSAVYYTPRILAKGKDHQLRKLLADLSARDENYDKASLEEGTRLALQYFKNHSFVHTPLYARLVLAHAYALVIDMATLFFFDFMLHNGFYGLVYTTYPWNRNPGNFSDSMSQHFPPYAFCTIDKYNLINNARVENYGCHLMLMELYEKVFIVIWFLLAVLIAVTMLSLLVLLFLWLPPFNCLLLRTCITSAYIRRVKREVLKISSVGDLFVLRLMKKHMNERQFLKFLECLVQAYDNHLKEVLVDSQQIDASIC